MLDKSIPYKDVFMKASPEAIQAATHVPLPDGYRFKLYEPGDAVHWARTEASVGEFPTEQDALDHFNKHFLAYPEETEKRCLFVVNADGLPVATTSAWFIFRGMGNLANVHWVAALPSEQGNHLGYAVVSEVMTMLATMHPGDEAWLHTQTWSHKAICLYHKLGFRIVSAKVLPGEKEPYDPQPALDILQGVLPPERFEKIRHMVD